MSEFIKSLGILQAMIRGSFKDPRSTALREERSIPRPPAEGVQQGCEGDLPPRRDLT